MRQPRTSTRTRRCRSSVRWRTCCEGRTADRHRAPSLDDQERRHDRRAGGRPHCVEQGTHDELIALERSSTPGSSRSTAPKGRGAADQVTRDIRAQVGREVPDGPASGQEGDAWEGEALSAEADAQTALHRGYAGKGNVEGGLFAVFPPN